MASSGGSRYILPIFVSVLFLLVMPLVQAEQQTLGTFVKGSSVNLIQICSNCTYNNISSIQYPNSTQAQGQIGMTKTGTYYNATFTRTTTIGQYIVNGFGDLDGTQTAWSYNFYITADGVDQTLQGRTNGLLWVSFAMCILFMVIGWQIQTERFVIKGALYFFALASLLIAGNFALDFETSAKSGKMVFSLFMVLVIGTGSFITWLLVTYFMGVTRALRDAKKAQEDSDDI